jgi:colanic acid biosynthesis glycosyl transferase WcaI
MGARAAVMLSQAAGTAVAAHLCGVRPDVVVNYGPPLIGPLLTSTVARRGHVPQVTVIYDLYPDVAIETGMLTGRAFIAIARWAERRTYRVSDRIVVLSEGFRRTLEDKDVSSSKVDVIPVWLDPDEIRPSPRLNRWRIEQGIDSNAFVILYAGTIGLVSGAEVMAEVADRLRDEPDLLFLFVGDGQTKAALESAAKQRGLTNIRFCAFQDRDRLNDVQATADVSVVTLAKGRGRTSVPSKVIGHLAAGRPTVASVDADSDTAGCVLAGPSGIVVPPGDVRQIADAILSLKHNPGQRAVLANSARSQFEEQYAAPAVMLRFAHLLEELHPVTTPVPRPGSRGRAARIRPMTVQDVPRAVEVHQAAFKNFFLTFLGPRFLRLLYGEAVKLDEIAFVAESDGDGVGLAMGSAQPGGFYGKLLKRRFVAFGVAAAPAVFRRPSVAVRVSKAVLKPRSAAKPEGTATLMSLAVLPAAQSNSAGRLLVSAFSAEARRRGATLVDLTTDRDQNEGANKFYLRVGFRLTGELVTGEGRALNEYELDVSQS